MHITHRCLTLIGAAALLLAATEARANPIFGTSGIAFDKDTQIQFTLDPYVVGGVAYEFQVYDVTGLPANWGATNDTVQTALAGPAVATLFEVPAGALDQALVGTSASFTFQAGRVYSLGIHFLPSDRGFVYAYSSTALNGFANPYAGVSGSHQYFEFVAEGSVPVGPVAANSNWQSWQSVDIESGPATVLLAVPGDPQQYYGGVEAVYVPPCVPLTACPAMMDCGTYADGCGGTLECGARGGACASGLQCGGGGGMNVCSCTTFATLGAPAKVIHGDVSCTGAAPPPGSVIEGDLIVPNGAVCALSGVSVRGHVHVRGGSFSAISSVIGGNLDVYDAGQVTLDACTEIRGDLLAFDSAGLGIAGTVRGCVEIEDSHGALANGNWICSSTINGDLAVRRGDANASFDIGGALHCQDGNTIHGSVELRRNLAPLTFDDNLVGRDLQCFDNASITAIDDTARHAQGQCSP